MKSFLLVTAFIGFACAGNIQYQAPAVEISPPNGEYGLRLGVAAPVAAAAVPAPAEVAPILKQSEPQNYAKQVPAAAIRNVETVDVKKTISPVITKTTTHSSHSEPALSVGHVQGYTQTHTGEPKFAEVQYNTVYTQYLNPTVGTNGPVTYSGPAVSEGVAVQQGLAVEARAVPVAPQYAIQQAPVQYAVQQAPAQYALPQPQYALPAAPAQYQVQQAPAPVPPQFAFQPAPAPVPQQYAAPAPVPQQYAAPAPVQYQYPAAFQQALAPVAAAPAPSFLSSLYSVSPAFFSNFAGPAQATFNQAAVVQSNNLYAAPPQAAAAPTSAVDPNSRAYESYPELGAISTNTLLQNSGYDSHLDSSRF